MRQKNFDIVKFVAIFLVIWGHCIAFMSSNNYEDNDAYRVIYSFHMPLFMVVSGFFAMNSLKMSLGKLILKKSIQLLLPCLTWGIILWGIAVIALKGESLELGVLSNQLSQNFWFLRCLFICFVIAWICKRIKTSWGGVFIRIADKSMSYSISFRYYVSMFYGRHDITR